MNHQLGWRIPVLLAVALCPLWFSSPRALAGARLEYNRDVRPILADNCFACHGPDSAARKASLRLDRRDDAIQAEAIVPGQPERSGAIERIFSNDPKKVMPPRKIHKSLTAAQKAILRQWVAEGAEYQPHWSLIAPRRPAVPAVRNAAWCRTAVDAFILAELEKRGLTPAPEADRRTLARRVSLDLIGLPPTPEEVEAFVRDPAPDAYEKYVDQLLKSPHWGEHRGRYWLDAARYADTHGIHFDNYREMWSYRDWVIRAFNRNLPFDQFTIEQLAGDLLPGRTLDQQVASGFNRCNITTNEGGAIAEEYLVLYARDRTETMAKVWLGLTANCAVCHDHKFDPLTMRDFYSLSAFFNNTTQAAMDGNIKDTPPVVPVPRPEDRPRWQQVSQQRQEVQKEIEARKGQARAAFDQWLAGARPESMAALVPQSGLRLHVPLDEGTGQTAHFQAEGKPGQATIGGKPVWSEGYVGKQAFTSQPGNGIPIPQAGDFEKDQPFSFGAWVKLTKRAQFGSVLARMDNQHDYRGWDLWLEENRFATHIIHKWQEDAIKVVSNTPLKLNTWNHLFFTYDGSGKAAGVKIYLDGVPQETTVVADGLKHTIRTTVPFKIGQRHAGQHVDGVAIQDVRVYGRALMPADVEAIVGGSRAAYLVSRPADSRSPTESAQLYDWWLAAKDAPYQKLAKRAQGLKQEADAIQSRGTVAHVMNERPEMPAAFILFRGEYDKRRDKVTPTTPQALPPFPADLPRNRLGLARWLLRPEHPLTARVTVNRFWQELFGTGLVRTSEDFGVSGELPSHPELLDWLAVEFREKGWNVREFFRMLVTSATYRQASVITPEKRERDPQNRLLSRGPRFRMDAEMVRDYALAASGLLQHQLGGPSVRPYQPEGVWEAVAMIGSDTRDYVQDHGSNLYRRSLYTFWKRAAPPASLDLFNAPTRETCTVRRERTNTPLQALVTLNDPQFVEAARHLAQLALGSNRTPANAQATDQGLDTMARRLLARPFREAELAVARTSLAELRAYYRAHPEDARKLIAVGESKADSQIEPAELAAWTMMANELMNLDEVLNK